jgi:hypothetical protein
MISRCEALGLALLILAPLKTTAAQDIRREFWPEANVYIERNDRLRFQLQNLFIVDHPDYLYTQGSFTGWVDVALRPVFRRELRRRGDVFRSRFLTFRAGYRYVTRLGGSRATTESRGLIEFMAKYPVPLKFVITDRSRLEFRFIHGQGYSTRYRNRLGIEHDLKAGPVQFTPYVYAEAFYDGRYDAWTTTRYNLGTQFQAGPHLVIEPYGAREHNTRSSTPHTHAIGLKLNFYL